MICPKCQNLLRTVDKNGVHIDQCEGCGGVFLDRGELEQIARAENEFYASAPPPYNPEGPPADAPPVMQPGYRDAPRAPRGGYRDSPGPFRGGYRDSPRPYRGGYRDSPSPYGHGRKRRRRGGFLEELLDFG